MRWGLYDGSVWLILGGSTVVPFWVAHYKLTTPAQKNYNKPKMELHWSLQVDNYARSVVVELRDPGLAARPWQVNVLVCRNTKDPWEKSSLIYIYISTSIYIYAPVCL